MEWVVNHIYRTQEVSLYVNVKGNIIGGPHDSRVYLSIYMQAECQMFD